MKEPRRPFHQDGAGRWVPVSVGSHLVTQDMSRVLPSHLITHSGDEVSTFASSVDSGHKRQTILVDQLVQTELLRYLPAQKAEGPSSAHQAYAASTTRRKKSLLQSVACFSPLPEIVSLR